MGVALPLITMVANWRGVVRHDEDALPLTKRWSKSWRELLGEGG